MAKTEKHPDTELRTAQGVPRTIHHWEDDEDGAYPVHEDELEPKGKGKTEGNR